MLTLWSGQAECLWDEALPVEVRELPEDLAALDRLLSDSRVLEPIVAHWQRELVETKRSVIADGRPTIAMETFVRLMVLKARHGWGYRTLVAEVSDSIHLRRFCRIALCERVPDESTIRKLTKRIGDETVSDVTRVLITRAVRERRFTARAVRIDSTVTDADIKYPTDAGLASAGVKALAREGRKLAERIEQPKLGVRDRSRSMGRALRAISRTIRRRSGQATSEVLELTARTGKLLERSIREARALAAAARAAARGRGAKAKLRDAARLEELADRCQKAAGQIRKRVAGDSISDRIVSLSDPDARPIRKGKLGKPNEFGYVTQIAEVTDNTRRGARGLILPGAASEIGNPTENALLPTTVAELDRLGLRPKDVALDGAFTTTETNQAFAAVLPDRVFISGRQQPGSKRTQRRLQRYRTGAEGRISHLKRSYGLGRTRLKGHHGHRTWTEWAILAYDLDTIAVRAG